MKLGALSTTIMQFEFEDGLRHLHELGLEAIEVGVGGLIPKNYGDPDKLLGDTGRLDRWLDAFQRYELEISAFSIHGLPLSPNKEVAAKYSRQFQQACKLAEAVGIHRLTLLAGLPEGAPGDTAPCWIVGPFPHVPTLQSIHKWQWEERVIPYWLEHAKIAQDHGVKLCFEMHPCDVVFNPESLMKLREAVGPVIGANFDPSHLFWQGIDPLEALRFLGSDVVYHVHAKDTRVQGHYVRVNGVLDPKPYSQIAERAWTFRTVGYGHGESFWCDFVSTLRLIGYDDVLSIEHEDEYMDMDEGLQKAVAFLRPLLLEKPAGPQWWDYGEGSSLDLTGSVAGGKR
jgi:sugar phosphate isomerase/epimerase